MAKRECFGGGRKRQERQERRAKSDHGTASEHSRACQIIELGGQDQCTQIPRSRMWRPSDGGSEAPETSERARRKARSHGERLRVSSDGLARSLWHNRGRSGRTGPPVPHRRGFVTAVEEARNYGLGFAVAQAKLRARIRWNRSRFSLAIFNTQAPACRTSLPGR